jgi:hypothetical protein
MATPKEHFMNVHDKISRAIWNMAQGIKDHVGANIVAAASSKVIKVEPNVLAQILALVNQSIEQSYHNSLKLVVAEVDALSGAAQAVDLQKRKR